MRYAVFVPVLLLLRAAILRCTPRSKTHVQLALALLIVLPSVVLALMMSFIRPRVERCADQDANPCNSTAPLPASPPPPARPGYSDPREEQCVSSVGGTDYCYYGGLPLDYVTVRRGSRSSSRCHADHVAVLLAHARAPRVGTHCIHAYTHRTAYLPHSHPNQVLGMLHSFLHYTLAFSQLVSLVSLALGGMASPSNPNLILDPDPNPSPNPNPGPTPRPSPKPHP